METADAAPLDAEKGAEIMEKYEKESRTRKFTADWLNKLVYVLCLAFTLYHLAYASGIHVLQMVNIKHHAIHVGLLLVIGFLLYPAFKKSSRKKVAWYDWVLFTLSAVMPIYVFIRYPVFISTGFQGETIDIIMGTILILLVLECSRRLSGPALSILSIIFLAYGLFGRYLPGIFMHRGYNWHRIVTYLTTDIYGIYGTSVKVAATYIVLFIIFGEVMNKCGMGQFFNDIANALATGLRRGELLGLKWTDVDLDRGMLKIQRAISRQNGKVVEAPLKTKNAYRTLPLSADAISVLKMQKCKVGNSEWVFPSPIGGPMSPDSVLHMLQRVLKRAGLPRIRFHDLRHTFATMALQNGVDIKTVSSMLGHYSAGFTLDTYAHVTTDAQLKAAQTMGNILSRAV